MKKKIFCYVGMIVFILILVGCGADYHFKKAEKLRSQGDYESAILKYEEILSNYINSQFATEAQKVLPIVYFEYGRKLQEQERYEEASGKYQILIDTYPTSPLLEKAKTNLLQAQIDLKVEKLLSGALQIENAGEYRKAIVQYQKIIKTYPGTSLAKGVKDRIEECKEELRRITYRFIPKVEEAVYEVLGAATRMIGPSLPKTLYVVDGNVFFRVMPVKTSGKNVEIGIDEKGLYNITINIGYRYDKYDSKYPEKFWSDDDLLEIWVGGFGYGFDWERGLLKSWQVRSQRWGRGHDWAEQGEVKRHLVGLKDKINRIKIRVYQTKYCAAKHDEYGNQISSDYYMGRLGAIITLRKGNADRFNWGNKNIKYGYWFRNPYFNKIKNEVKKNTSVKYTSGKWLKID